MQPVLGHPGLHLGQLYHLVTPYFVRFGESLQSHPTVGTASRVQFYQFIYLGLRVLGAIVTPMSRLSAALAPRGRSIPLGTTRAWEVSRGRSGGVLRVLAQSCLQFPHPALQFFNPSLHGQDQSLGQLWQLLPELGGQGKVRLLAHGQH